MPCSPRTKGLVIALRDVRSQSRWYWRRGGGGGGVCNTFRWDRLGRDCPQRSGSAPAPDQTGGGGRGRGTGTAAAGPRGSERDERAPEDRERTKCSHPRREVASVGTGFVQGRNTHHSSTRRVVKEREAGAHLIGGFRCSG